MKKHRIAIPALSTAALLTLFSCNTDDPSAAGELQRNLAAALAKNSNLEKEVASLTEQLQQAQQSGAEAESMKMPTRAEIEKSLAIEGTKLQQIARDLHPDSKVEGFGTFDLNIPSFETPFSCKAKVQLRNPSGQAKTLYWIGNATIKGEWKFEQAENLEPAPVVKEVPAPTPAPVHDIPMTDPLIPGKGTSQPAPPSSQPKQAEPEKPKVKYDIPLDNPVLKPRGR